MMLGLFLAAMTGGALSGDTLYTWGTKLVAWTLPKLTSRTLVTPAAPATAGCLDQEGTGLFLQEGGRLVYRKSPDWKPRPIDHGMDMHDCLRRDAAGPSRSAGGASRHAASLLRVPGFPLQGNLLVLQPREARGTAR